MFSFVKKNVGKNIRQLKLIVLKKTAHKKNCHHQKFFVDFFSSDKVCGCSWSEIVIKGKLDVIDIIIIDIISIK